jgi:hypothetical protein
MDLAVVGGTFQRQPPFYERIGRVEVGPDVTRWYFTAIFLDVEGYEGGTSIMLKAWQCRRCESSRWLTALRLLQVSCHGSAGTPLRTHAGTEALGLEDARTAIRT